VAEDLRNCQLLAAACEGFTHLEEAFHGLEATYSAKVNPILKRTHGNERACKDAFPILEQAARYCGHND
jgi:hypothetical protein